MRRRWEVLVQLFQAEVLGVLNETGTELGFSPWSPGSCDEVRTSQWRGSQHGKGTPYIKPGVIPYIEEESKYLPTSWDQSISKGNSLVLSDHAGTFFNPLSTRHVDFILLPTTFQSMYVVYVFRWTSYLPGNYLHMNINLQRLAWVGNPLQGTFLCLFFAKVTRSDSHNIHVRFLFVLFVLPKTQLANYKI